MLLLVPGKSTASFRLCLGVLAILQGGVGCYLTREYVESLSGSESCFHMEKCDNSAEQQTSVISEL